MRCSMLRLTMLLVAGIPLLGLQRSATALVVTADGTVVFHDDFEQHDIGATPVNAIVGFYNNPEGLATVENASPTAYQGTKYLHLVRPTELLMQANFADSGGSPIAVNPGQTLQMAFALYADSSGSNGPINIQLRSAGGILDFALLGNSNGTVDLFDFVYGVSSGTVPWTFNQWQVWTVEYVVGTNALKLTIDGNSQTFTNVHGSAGLDRIVFTGRTGSNDIYNIDSLPVANVPGDFDTDGDVDGADFVAWQTHFPTESGATLATGDADGDGDVDGADFVVWQTHFPTTPGGGISSIPEPMSCVLAMIGGAGVYLLRRRRSTMR